METQTTKRPTLYLDDLEDKVNEAFYDCYSDYFKEINNELDRLAEEYSSMNSIIFDCIKAWALKLEMTTDEYIIEDLSPNMCYVPKFDYVDFDFSDFYSSDQYLIDNLKYLESEGVINNLVIHHSDNTTILANFNITKAISLPIEAFNEKMKTLYSVADYFHNW